MFVHERSSRRRGTHEDSGASVYRIAGNIHEGDNFAIVNRLYTWRPRPPTLFWWSYFSGGSPYLERRTDWYSTLCPPGSDSAIQRYIHVHLLTKLKFSYRPLAVTGTSTCLRGKKVTTNSVSHCGRPMPSWLVWLTTKSERSESNLTGSSRNHSYPRTRNTFVGQERVTNEPLRISAWEAKSKAWLRSFCWVLGQVYKRISVNLCLV